MGRTERAAKPGTLVLVLFQQCSEEPEELQSLQAVPTAQPHTAEPHCPELLQHIPGEHVPTANLGHRSSTDCRYSHFYISKQNFNPHNLHQLTLGMVMFSSQKLRRSQNFLIQRTCPETTQFQQVWEIHIFEAWVSLGAAKSYSP